MMREAQSIPRSRAIVGRLILLSLCATAVIAIAVALWMTTNLFGYSGARWAPSRVPFVDRVVSLQTGTPADIAGVRVGDRLDIRDLSPAARLRHRNGLVFGQTVVLPIRRDGTRMTVTFAPWLYIRSPGWHAGGWDQLLSVVGEFLAVFVAALIVWRRPDSAEALLLALVLILTNLATAISTANFWVTPWPAVDLIAYIVAQPLGAAGVLLVATYALQFGRPISRARWILTWTTYAIVAFSALVADVGIAGEWLGLIDSQTWFFASTAPAIALIAVPSILPLVCAALALRDAAGNERTRLSWAAGSLAIVFIAAAFWQITQTLGIYVRSGVVVVDIAAFVYPLGLTYALLNRSLLDVGFALNRAAVFAATSLLIAGLFSGLQWLANAFITGLVGAHSVVVNLTIVVLVYYIMRIFRSQTDAVVSTLFFAARNRRLHTLRELPQMIDRISEAEAIAPFVVKELRAGANVEACVTWQEPERESDATTNPEPGGQWVEIPMLVRGQLRGMLFCQGTDGGTFAPDEMLALEQIAYRMATDRDDILATLLRSELRALRSQPILPPSQAVG